MLCNRGTKPIRRADVTGELQQPTLLFGRMTPQPSNIAVSETGSLTSRGRNTRFDFMKSVMLLIILIGHIRGFFPAWKNYTDYLWTPFGIFSMAEGFLFLSAITTAQSLSHCHTLRALYQKMLPRIYRIYLYHVVTVIFVAVVTSHSLVAFWQGSGLDEMRAAPFYYSFIALFFIYCPPLLEIFPLYIILLIISPLLIVAIRSRKRATALLIISALLWYSVQSAPLRDGNYFNLINFFHPLAWQFPFVIGVIYGSYSNSEEGFIPSSTKRYIAALEWVSLVICSIFICIRYDIVPPSLSEDIHHYLYLFSSRRLMSVGLLLNLFAFSLALRLIARFNYGNWPICSLMGKYVGRNSLLVYFWSIITYYSIVGTNFTMTAHSAIAQNIMFAFLIASLSVPLIIKSYVKRFMNAHQNTSKTIPRRLI